MGAAAFSKCSLAAELSPTQMPNQASGLRPGQCCNLCAIGPCGMLLWCHLPVLFNLWCSCPSCAITPLLLTSI